jgi:hypothetical protein
MEKAPPVPGQELATAIAEAEEMFLYAARKGINVPDETSKAIVGARKRGPADQWSEEDQVKFWRSAQALAKLVQPSTIDSIRATTAQDGGGKSIVVWIYSGISIIVLIALIWVQIVYVKGVTVTANIESIKKEQMDAQYEAIATELQIKEADTSAIAGARERPQAAEASQPRPTDPHVTLQRDKDRVAMADRQLQANDAILRDWASSFWVGYAPTSPSTWASRLFMSNEDIEREKTQISEEQKIEPDVQYAAAMATLKWMLGYLLPLLYGLLGTAAYVMRSLSKEISEATFSNASHVRFGLRLVLGALSGIGVGLILTHDTLPPTLAAVTPLGLAFLAGYSVELLFSAMDRLILAFSSDGTRSPGK